MTKQTKTKDSQEQKTWKWVLDVYFIYADNCCLKEFCVKKFFVNESFHSKLLLAMLLASLDYTSIRWYIEFNLNSIADGNIITAEDLRDYTVEKRKPLKTTISNGDWTLISFPPPSGGIAVQYILRILDGKNYSLSRTTELSVRLVLQLVPNNGGSISCVLKSLEQFYVKDIV